MKNIFIKSLLISSIVLAVVLTLCFENVIIITGLILCIPIVLIILIVLSIFSFKTTRWYVSLGVFISFFINFSAFIVLSSFLNDQKMERVENLIIKIESYNSTNGHYPENNITKGQIDKDILYNTDILKDEFTIKYRQSGWASKVYNSKTKKWTSDLDKM